MKKPDLYWHAQKICSISQFEIVIVRDLQQLSKHVIRYKYVEREPALSFPLWTPQHHAHPTHKHTPSTLKAKIAERQCITLKSQKINYFLLIYTG